jgi:hypothetical protein
VGSRGRGGVAELVAARSRPSAVAMGDEVESEWDDCSRVLRSGVLVAAVCVGGWFEVRKMDREVSVAARPSRSAVAIGDEAERG